MRYEKLRGKSTAELMMRIRSMYGSSAYVMATREVREGGILGSGLLSKKVYEIEFMVPEAAANARSGSPARGEVAEPERSSRVSQPTFRRMERDSSHEPASMVAPPKDNRTRTPSLDHILRTETTPEEILSLLSQEDLAGQSHAHPEREAGSASRPSEFPRPPEFPQREPLSRLPERAGEGAPDESELTARPLRQMRNRLLEAHFSREFTESFLVELERSLSQVDMRELRRVEERALAQLALHIRAVPDIAPVRGECRAVMLVGPTGMGKTTSVAKLAARYSLYQGREVSLYSLDHCRLAATEQLKSYASIIDVPFHAPLNPEEFSEQLRRDGAELMLIDTHGIGFRDQARIADLNRFVAACEVRLEKHLVMAANTAPSLVEKILLAYDVLGFDKIIITKLDEGDFIGSFVEHADKFNRPFSFLMNGQEVTEDILDARPDEMARMLLKAETRSEAVHF